MSSTVILGIDCGYRHGGVALVGDEWAEVHDLPVYSEGGVDVVALMDIITSADVEHIYIERQQAMPKQGVSSTFKIGFSFVQIVTMAAVSRTPFTIVSPSIWKKFLGLQRDKESARGLAQQWFPELASSLTKKKDEHRAEALLLAEYGRGRP